MGGTGPDRAGMLMVVAKVRRTGQHDRWHAGSAGRERLLPA
jgi:hypothetical protein